MLPVATKMGSHEAEGGQTGRAGLRGRQAVSVSISPGGPPPRTQRMWIRSYSLLGRPSNGHEVFIVLYAPQTRPPVGGGGLPSPSGAVLPTGCPLSLA